MTLDSWKRASAHDVGNGAVRVGHTPAASVERQSMVTTLDSIAQKLACRKWRKPMGTTVEERSNSVAVSEQYEWRFEYCSRQRARVDLIVPADLIPAVQQEGRRTTHLTPNTAWVDEPGLLAQFVARVPTIKHICERSQMLLYKGRFIKQETGWILCSIASPREVDVL